MPERIIIDTDPGIDDAMAIFYALASPELEVVGLTTIFGNVHTPLATLNALRLLEIAGRSDIPVAEGSPTPLVMPLRHPADFVHGVDGQGNTHLPPPSTRPDPRSAAQFIVDTVMASPGEITLVPIGPLTNIALAMRLRPDLTRHVRRIVLMGGNAFVPGNASPSAEANILNDPEAADIVFGADCEIVMAGLDVTHRVNMTLADIDALAAIDRQTARHLSAILPFYVDFYRSRNHLDGIYVHDSTAISYLLAPDAFTWREHPIRVDTGASVGRGRTVPDIGDADNILADNPWFGRRPVRLLTDVDSRAVIALEHARLANGA